MTKKNFKLISEWIGRNLIIGMSGKTEEGEKGRDTKIFCGIRTSKTEIVTIEHAIEPGKTEWVDVYIYNGMNDTFRLKADLKNIIFSPELLMITIPELVNAPTKPDNLKINENYDLDNKVSVFTPREQLKGNRILFLHNHGRINLIDTENDYVFTDIPVIGGTSGSPILDSKLNIIAIVSRAINHHWSQGVGASTIKQFQLDCTEKKSEK